MATFKGHAMFKTIIGIWMMIVVTIIVNGVTGAGPQDGVGAEQPQQPAKNMTCSAQIASSRAGTCPAPNQSMRCFVCNDNCRSDNECGNQQKCCPQPGCGNFCSAAVTISR